MSPVEAVGSVLSNYVNFSGRASRSEYWWWLGAWALGYIVSLFLFATDIGLGAIVLTIFVLATFIPYLAVTVRRLHDSGRSGWWLLIGVIPLGGLVILAFMFMDTEPAMNRWGPPAKGSRYAKQGWSASPAMMPGQWPGSSAAGTGGAVGSAGARTKIFTGATTSAAEAAFRADLAGAAGAGYQAVAQRWDATQPQPTLVVDYEPVPRA